MHLRGFLRKMTRVARVVLKDSSRCLVGEGAERAHSEQRRHLSGDLEAKV